MRGYPRKAKGIHFMKDRHRFPFTQRRVRARGPHNSLERLVMLFSLASRGTMEERAGERRPSLSLLGSHPPSQEVFNGKKGSPSPLPSPRGEGVRLPSPHLPHDLEVPLPYPPPVRASRGEGMDARLSRCLKIPRSATWGHAAYRIPRAIASHVGPVPSPGGFLNGLLAWHWRLAPLPALDFWPCPFSRATINPRSSRAQTNCSSGWGNTWARPSSSP